MENFLPFTDDVMVVLVHKCVQQTHLLALHLETLGYIPRLLNALNGLVNNNRTTALELTAAQANGGLHAFYWYQIFALDSAVVEVQEMFSSHGSLLTIAMYHHGETL